MHQHGSCGTPVWRSVSNAHAFKLSQSGQRAGSTEEESSMRRLSFALVTRAQRAGSLPTKAKCDAIGLDSGNT